jgi:5-oxoprolinase (ATP-hydrolysing)
MVREPSLFPSPMSGSPKENAPKAAWRIAVDTGGTFVDAWAKSPEGHEKRCKLLSSSALRTKCGSVDDSGTRLNLVVEWNLKDQFFAGFEARSLSGERASVESWGGTLRTLHLSRSVGITAGDTVELTSHEEAPVLAARILTETPLGASFPAIELRLSTTRATNALLERRGARVAFFTTEGFRDLLIIGDQRRPDLFALQHQRPDPIYDRAYEIPGRLTADGTELVPLDTGRLAKLAAEAIDAGCEAAAVAFVNSYTNPTHELQAKEVLRNAGFQNTTLSAELSGRIKLLPRAQTTVANATVAPIMNHFIGNVIAQIGETVNHRILVMSSAGGLEAADTFQAKDSLFSGPAGGVVGSAAIARSVGLDRVITFDMGGTSTDVARWDGEFDYQTEQRIGNTTVFGTSMRIETVAAGGGSICAVKPSGLTVGPESAGASPGPACYGLGGPLTLTDVNLLLGRLDPDKVSIPLHAEAAREKFEELKGDMERHGLATSLDDETLLNGLLDIGIERMAEVIRKISVRQGYDPAEFALIAFGGAGPQHACAIADRLGIDEIIVPETAGILSACGVGEALRERFAEQQFLTTLDAAKDDLDFAIQKIEERALQNLINDGASGSITGRFADLRLSGQESTLTVSFEAADELEDRFSAAYHKLYGYPPPGDRSIELVSVRVRAASNSPPSQAESFESESIQGHRLIHDDFSTLIIAKGWSAQRGSRGSWKLCKSTGVPSTSRAVSSADAVEAELFRNRFNGIAEQMGVLLQRTSISTNVKERLDFSCAILNASGELVVNAPHIPVHLGALGECVRRSTESRPLTEGDILVTNHPAFGGSHLPDVTVMAPLFIEGEPIAYCANRAHHAEIGGITPGSMPAFATSLTEEGAVIAPDYLFRQGEARYDWLRNLLLNAPFPTRAIDDNLADLHAQVAAVRQGIDSMRQLCAQYGPERVRVQLQRITEATAAAFFRQLSTLPDIVSRARQELDDGTVIQVVLEKRRTTLEFNFAGTSAQHPGNLNATPAIVRSAVLYVLQLLSDENLPLNEGLLRHVSIQLPGGCFLNPEFVDDASHCPAVVGGNVETSQRLVDALIEALNLQACSQGTMNNVIFGNPRFGYYETLCGGSGAGDGYSGTDAIHTHMTNTAITDVEVLEHRYPARLDRFSIRHGSGGRGQYFGGNGAIRQYTFLEPVTLSLLTEHRQVPPFGLGGGQPGACGRQTVVHKSGDRESLPSQARVELEAGDSLIVETPGGGGFGNK